MTGDVVISFGPGALSLSVIAALAGYADKIGSRYLGSRHLQHTNMEVSTVSLQLASYIGRYLLSERVVHI